MERPVILERVNNNWYLWKVFQYFPTDTEAEKVLEREKRLFPEKEFKFDFAEIAF